MKKMSILRPGFAVLASGLVALRLLADPASPSPSASPAATDTLPDIRIVLHTSRGAIAATLFTAKAPLTVASFLNLAQHKFYDGLTFHRVIRGFMIQGGDPDGSGSGTPGYEFKDEITSLRFDKSGVLAMANHGQNTDGSQFFITQAPTPHLNGRHTIFGQVTAGQPTVDETAQGDTIQSIEILDPTDALFSAEAPDIEKWNAALAERAAKKTPPGK